ncbi:hypothetical protein CSB37_00205 [bacterium DOLZORAL124_38_8]|nr:MAG: hypothetical protein CSB37_00205 [bacterium DOLZORAL124_38_8]
MRKIVSNQISPNLFLSDWFYAGWKTLLGKQCAKENFEQFFRTKNFFLCNTARSALWKICELAEIPKNKKIGIPAFICAVVATPFLDQSYEIEWIDTNENGLICPKDLAKKIKNLGAVVVPHIFGQPANIQAIKTLCTPQNILVIEDCAHHFNPKEPIIADVRIASFGREKVYSCVSGGAVFWQEESRIAAKLKNLTLKKSSQKWERQHWMQIFWYGLALPWWNWGGKIIPHIAKKLNWLPLAVSKNEKNGTFEHPLTQMGTKQKWVLWRQFSQSKIKTIHNQIIAQEWKKLLSQFFPSENIIIPDDCFRVILKCDHQTQQKIITTAQKHKYYLRDWDGQPIAPAGTNLQALNYEQKNCPKAEKFSQSYVTFPTNLRTSKKQVQNFKKVLVQIY